MKNFFFSPTPTIVFSHLRWEFVTQRPQHIMTRLGQHGPVIFVEEPVEGPPVESSEEVKHSSKALHSKRAKQARIFSGAKNVTVVQPYAKWENYTTEVGSLVRQIIQEKKWKTPRLWFYSPMFVEMIDQVPHQQVIFDCMDELSAFLDAPQELIQNEQLLLSKSDIVFTGGRSLYESKRRFHNNAHCFPSSVDQKHFEQALSKKTTLPVDIAHIPGPIVGFYGVIDERLDLKLLSQLADLNPQVSFVVIGPVVKINHSDLPQQKNIHYLGGKDYSQLPSYLKAFDITMMPFALNESTKFISPTKTLEFMAAQKPIISTAIKDVAEVYPREVAVVQNSLEFTAAIRSYLSESVSARKLRHKLQAEVIKKTSWDNTVKEMLSVMKKADHKLQLESNYSHESQESNVQGVFTTRFAT